MAPGIGLYSATEELGIDVTGGKVMVCWNCNYEDYATSVRLHSKRAATTLVLKSQPGGGGDKVARLALSDRGSALWIRVTSRLGMSGFRTCVVSIG